MEMIHAFYWYMTSWWHLLPCVSNSLLLCIGCSNNSSLFFAAYSFNVVNVVKVITVAVNLVSLEKKRAKSTNTYLSKRMVCIVNAKSFVFYSQPLTTSFFVVSHSMRNNNGRVTCKLNAIAAWELHTKAIPIPYHFLMHTKANIF